MTLKDGTLTEWEAKASRIESKSVAKDNMGYKQGSQSKNRRRARTMLGKEKKIGLPSDRQGGPYTRQEIDLWRDVRNLGGYKQHMGTLKNRYFRHPADSNPLIIQAPNLRKLYFSRCPYLRPHQYRERKGQGL